MKRIIILIIFTLILTGCSKTNEVELKMDCNGTVETKAIKVDDKLSCELLGEDYEFKITKINDDGTEVIIKVNEYGLTNTSSLLDKKDKFTITKGKKLTLNTQSTDYQEEVSFEIIEK